MYRSAVLASVSCLVTSLCLGQGLPEGAITNWHQWRGPLATGVAPEADPPVTWDAQTNIQWKVDLPGMGSSTPIVWGDRIFILTAVDTQRPGPGPAGSGPSTLHQFVVVCIDRNTGNTLWQKVAAELVPHEGHHDTNNFSPISPITDGESLYVSFGSRGIYCYDLDGNLRWERDLGDMETKLGFGEGSSPALYGGKLIVNWDHEGQSFIAALDARTGDELWRTPRDEGTTWGTPLVVEGAGRTQVVTSGEVRMRSYDLATGNLLWESEGLGPNPIPSPVRQDDMVILMTGFRTYHLFAVPLTASGNISGSDTFVWQRGEGTPYVPSPLLYDGLLYFNRGNSNVLTCVDARTGRELYTNERLQGLNTLYASPVGAAGRIYVLDREGTCLVLRAGPDFEILATNRLPSDEDFDASPVPVGNQLLLRGEKTLYCISQQ